MLLAEPLEEPRRRRLEPGEPFVAPAVAPERRIGRHRVHRDLADRVLAELADRHAAADVVDVAQVAVVGAHDRDDRAQVRRPELRDLDRGERAVADAPHPDRAVAPRLGGEPLDGVVPVERLGLGVLVERDAARRAGPADVDPAQGVAAPRRGTCRARRPRCAASCPCRTGSSRGSPGSGRRVRTRPPDAAATGSPTARRRRAPGSGRPRRSRPRGAARSRGGRGSRRGRSSPGVYEPRRGGRTEPTGPCDDAAMDDEDATAPRRRTDRARDRQRPVDAPRAARRLRERVDHRLARRGDPARRRPGHLRRRPLRQPGGRRARRSTTTTGSCSSVSTATRSTPTRGRSRRAASRPARAPSRAPGASCARRPASRPPTGASWPASTSRTASPTSSRSCSSRPA